MRDGNSATVVRHLKWESVPVENARRMFSSLPEHLDLEGIETAVVPRDWGWNFQDCDAVIAFADAGLGAVLPLVPTLFYCTDLAARIIPEAFASSIEDPYWQRQIEAFRIWRQAHVATSDAGTIEDLVSYAGVRRLRVHLSPNFLAPETSDLPAQPARDPDLLVWYLGPSALDGLNDAATGLNTYLSEGGNLQPVIVTDQLLEQPDRRSLDYPYGLPTHLADLIYGLPTRQVSSERELSRLLRRASVIWSSRLAGGEGEIPLLAAEHGLRFIGADYDANRANASPGASQLYALDDPLAIADGLHQIEALEAPTVISKQPQGSDAQVARLRELLLSVTNARDGA